jgi:hypothetical protein
VFEAGMFDFTEHQPRINKLLNVENEKITSNQSAASKADIHIDGIPKNHYFVTVGKGEKLT